MVKVRKTKEQVITEKLEEKATAPIKEEKIEALHEVAKGNVTVACGIPMGLVLNLSTGPVELAGLPMSHLVSARKNGTFLPAGKYGLTTVTADQWEEIKAKYGRHDFMVNGTVFAKEDSRSVEAEAKEKSGNHLGFEQADPTKGRTKKSSKED